MRLAAGTRLGPYEILAPIGAGGMGEVYRARDSRLDRDVAIKVLPEHVAQDPEARARFEREARAVAGLSHPNILAIHDFGEEDGTAYAVTELLEGGTLRERLGNAALPVRKVLDYGVQIAQGLAGAHEKGVVHRDLKPENIFITEDGRAKILDFGLAKLELAAHEDLTASPTVAVGTRPGTVLGTMGYMSPEQVRGRDVDARSDLFAFGSVLYEMLSGERAFWRDTAADTMSCILREDPPSLSTASQEVAPALQRIVEHCLEKGPAERFQSARDLAFHLEAVGTASSSVVREPIQEPDDRPRRGLPRAAPLLAGLAVGLVAGGLLVAQFLSPEPYEPPRLRYLSYSGRENIPSASPDGRLIAHESTHGDRSQIWVKQFPGGNEVALTDGPDDRAPRISPDGSQVLFTRVEGALTSLFRIPVVGGEPRKILDDAYDGDWSPDGEQVAFLRDRSVDGGIAVSLGIVDPGGQGSRDILTLKETRLWSPRWSPDGRTIAAVQGGMENSPHSILLVDAETGATRALHPPPPAGRLSAPAWNGDGKALIYTVSETIAIGDQSSGRLIVQEIESGRSEIRMWLPTTADALDVLAPGTLVMGVASRRQNLREVDLVDGAAAGKPRRVTRGSSTDRQPVFSRDGRWMLFSSNRGGNLDLWKLSVETGAIRRVTEDDDADWDPAFTADGANILWSTDRGGHFEIWTCAADGTGARQLTQDGVDAENPTATPDGQWIVYNSINPEHVGLWKIHLDGTGAQRLVPGSWSVPDVSPDGRHVAFRTSTEPRALSVARVDDGEIVAGPWELPGSQTSGRARWMPDGRHLLFTGLNASGNRGIFIQEFSAGRDTRSTRRPLHGFDEDQPPESFGVSPDGRRLVYSSADILESLMLVEGLQGIAPARSPAQP